MFLQDSDGCSELNRQNNFVFVKFSCTEVYKIQLHRPDRKYTWTLSSRRYTSSSFMTVRSSASYARAPRALLYAESSSEGGVFSIAPRRVCTLHHCTGCRHALSVVNALLKGAWSAEAAAYFQRLQNLCGATVPSRRNYSIGDFENELRILMIISF